MPLRLVLPLLGAALLLPLAAAPPAAAQSPEKDYLFQRRLGNACRPPLKFAAGACVRRCPSGYQDMGRHCRLRNQGYGGD